MTTATIIVIAFALSMDAFAVSISCGIKLNRFLFIKYLKIALFFGAFQAGMPLIGWFAGGYVKGFIESFAPLIAGSVFAFLGAKTLYSTLTRKQKTAGPDTCQQCNCSNWSCLTSLSVATSIDALIIGLVFALYDVTISFAVLTIGLITFAMSLAGNLIGNRAGAIFGKRAEIIAGVILLGLAVKAFLEY